MRILHFIIGKGNKHRSNGVNQVISGICKYSIKHGRSQCESGGRRRRCSHSHRPAGRLLHGGQKRRFGTTYYLCHAKTAKPPAEFAPSQRPIKCSLHTFYRLKPRQQLAIVRGGEKSPDCRQRPIGLQRMQHNPDHKGILL